MSPEKPPKGERWEDLLWQKHHYNDRTIIKSGSYLRSSCPHCNASLMQEEAIHLETTSADGEEGWIELSPYLNVFDHRSSISLTDGQEVAELRCPHCHASLRVAGRVCGRGDAHVACFLVGISSVQVPFYFCMRVGCRWHETDPDDLHKIILDDSTEW